jgi:hypothetical protein
MHCAGCLQHCVAVSVNRRRPIDNRREIGFGWLQNAWLLHARLKILTGGLKM